MATPDEFIILYTDSTGKLVTVNTINGDVRTFPTVVEAESFLNTDAPAADAKVHPARIGTYAANNITITAQV